MQLQRTNRKTIQLPRLRWTKYGMSAPKTCRITSINAKQRFLLPTSLKKAKNMPNYDVHTKPLLKRPNFWNLATLVWLPVNSRTAFLSQ